MRKRYSRPERNTMLRQKSWLFLLVAALLLLPGSGCDSPETPENVETPTWSTEPSETTGQTRPTETGSPTESTQATEPSVEPSTEPTAEPTAEPTVEPTVEPTEAPTQAPTTPPPMEIKVSPDQTEVLLVPSNVRGFFRRDLSKEVELAIYSYKPMNQRIDVAVPVTITVDISNIPAGLTVTSVTVTLFDNAERTNGQEYHLPAGKLSVDIHFLLARHQYYYQVRIAFSDGSSRLLDASFRTAALPRILSIDGVVNFRDIGGYTTTDGYVIRQGLFYRGSELDGAVKSEYKLTETGRRQMLEILGIRTDLDLRYLGDIGTPASPLGPGVTYFVYDSPGYADIFKAYGRSVVRQIFTELANPDRYPVYLHCTYGTDRTGTICYLLGALLGVSETDLQREYELSTLYHTWVNSPGYQSMVAQLNTYEGDTLKDKAENFLQECGVLPEQIAQIRSIFLEKQ